MKEIIYIQAGNVSNHIGTHFWNAQQSYFTYKEGEEVLIDNDVSFREGVSPRGEPTYCPRLLQFDRKANFGSLSSATGLYAVDSAGEFPPSSIWDGGVDEIYQDHISDGLYQTQLDEEIEEDVAVAPPEPQRSTVVPPLCASDVRYWSDYDRVYHLPRSIHKLPDLADWEAAEGDWRAGKEAFLRYDLDHSVMDDSFRLFVEECDTFQGLQLCTDNASFGSFCNSLLTVFRDEFPKQPTLTFAVLSDAVPGDIDVDDIRGIQKALNDASCLHGLNELSTMSIPLQSPNTWLPGAWSTALTTDLRNHYDTSAILSAHVETVTLPLRLKKNRELLYGFCNQLNVYGNTPFAELSGAFPASSVEVLDSTTYGFTRIQPLREDRWSPPLHRRNVTRGWTELTRRRFDDLDAVLAISASAHSLHTQIEYPLPSSFPSFFRAQHLNADLLRTPRGILTQARSTPMVSTLGSGWASPFLLTQYAEFLRDCLRRKVDWATLGMDEDDARELRDDLWTMRDNFGEKHELSGDDGGGLGEDEEY
ncbi:tubulin nucleotide-binding domain-like protein [Lactarius akahatsu]|uniref:Tubulin nucleotide-binding domain-like protein n=1 Tax=Lactarius akahatsu TaxID=416441 RepID=A0AAD4LLY0_9AGAM|nr:tubulin nucleotide-binding domain-like protein [Lactarius akahatsu]